MVDTGRPGRTPAAHSTDARSTARPRRGRQRRPGPATVGGLVREAAVVLVIALVLASLLRAFVVQAFVIPSGSMEDTLRCDVALSDSCDASASDRVVVSKLTTRFAGVSRGQIVVFQDPAGWLTAETGTVPVRPGVVRRGLQFVGLVPNDAEGHLIKRVIGVGGDRVQTDSDDRVLVNGHLLDEEPYLKAGVVPSACTFDVTVPQGDVFVLGDNRANSSDSRFHGRDANGGMVPLADVTGRAVARVWPVSRIGGLGVPSTFAAVPAPTAATRSARARPPAPGATACPAQP